MVFSQCYEFSPFKASTKEWGSSISTKKKWSIYIFLNHCWIFLAFVEEIYPLSLIFDLGYLFWSKIQPQNHCFPIKVFGFIKNNITTHDNILAYKVTQYVPLSFFIIANEYAFDTFGIQLCPCFIWHMSKCNTIKNM
jgi:hypothetical protein